MEEQGSSGTFSRDRRAAGHHLLFLTFHLAGLVLVGAILPLSINLANTAPCPGIPLRTSPAQPTSPLKAAPVSPHLAGGLSQHWCSSKAAPNPRGQPYISLCLQQPGSSLQAGLEANTANHHTSAIMAQPQQEGAHIPHRRHPWSTCSDNQGGLRHLTPQVTF